MSNYECGDAAGLDDAESEGELDGAELVDDLIGEYDYAPSLPVKKKFLPWHKPRKQYVRNMLWKRQITFFLRDYKKLKEWTELRYLGLPGEDFLDIRYFHEEICKPSKLTLKFLGFNRSAKNLHSNVGNKNRGEISQANVNVSKHEVFSLEYVDSNSDVILDDFKSIGSSTSFAWKQAVSFGSYDVVNLDLCNGFCIDLCGSHTPDNYDALRSVFKLQARRQEPWLLFLTTKVGRDDIHEKILESCFESYEKCLKECEDFQNESAKKLGAHSGDCSFKESDEHRNNAFLVGLCGWVLKLGLELNPYSEVTVADLFGYCVEPTSGAIDMVSLAFLIVPTYEDSVNVFNGCDVSCALKVALIDKISCIKDVDKKLENDRVIYDRMVEATQQLLKSARYDIDGYQEWLQE